MMAQLTGSNGKVFAFEPDPDNFSLLSKHIHLNGFNHIIEAVPFAVSSSSGKAMFQKGSSSSTGKLSSSSEEEGLEVEMVSLDDFVYRMGYPQPDFVKIDVEGFEGEVLNGASRVLAQTQPIILGEIHNLQAAGKVLRKLNETDYLILNVERDFELVNNLEFGSHWLAYPKQKGIFLQR